MAESGRSHLLLTGAPGQQPGEAPPTPVPLERRRVPLAHEGLDLVRAGGVQEGLKLLVDGFSTQRSLDVLHRQHQQQQSDREEQTEQEDGHVPSVPRSGRDGTPAGLGGKNREAEAGLVAVARDELRRGRREPAVQDAAVLRELLLGTVEVGLQRGDAGEV